MKQIFAILIAFFLCTSATQVSAQQADTRVLDMVTTAEPYTFALTDSWVVFANPGSTIIPPSSCTLPDPKLPSNKGRVLHIINRRNNSLTVNNLNLAVATNLIVVPYRQAIEVMCDGVHWFLLNKSTF